MQSQDFDVDRSGCAGWFAFVSLIILSAVLVGSCSGNRTSPTATESKEKEATVAVVPGQSEFLPKTGRELYLHHCAACHGENGDGKGIASAYLFPKPRDFRAGKFRLVSTKNNVPTPEDLDAALVRGMPGSSMPPWNHLNADQRKLLVEEVVRLRREGAREQYIRILKEVDELTDEEIAEADVQQEIEEIVSARSTPSETTEVPEIGDPNTDSIARGKEIYVKQSCHSCHGNDGKGGGVQKMIDDEGLPTRPRDFTLGIFKGGHDPASLYRRIAYGMPGTPMPSSKQLTVEQMVDLVHFTRSLSDERTRQAAILRREKLVVNRLDAVPTFKDVSSWAGIEAVSIKTIPLWWRDDADAGLEVQAAHDGKSLALRLTWRDDTYDNSAATTTSFEDAVAVELFRGKTEPFIGMGDPKSPVDVWYWDADRQSASDMEDVYPNAVVDIYPFNEKLVATAEFNRPGTKAEQQPDVSLPARASGNPIVPKNDGSGTSSLTGGGPGTVTFRLPKSELVKAHGAWNEGRWTVVMTRSLAVSSADDGVSLSPGGKATIAFAIWNGSLRERDGKKLITIWQDLELEK